MRSSSNADSVAVDMLISCRLHETVDYRCALTAPLSDPKNK